MGGPYMNRDDPATAAMLGLFVDKLPLCLVLDESSVGSSAIALLDAVASEINLCVANYMPYAQIGSAVVAADKKPAPRLFDTMAIPGVQVREPNKWVKPAGTLFSLQLGYIEQPGDGGLLVDIDS
ncbi:hypothetical protein GGR54DRAFT_644540 [Hypoxylon sp. NC1633]|nr:hypothetical protein GGR54DRAFT_644540 [Hypoxylon sp. NC1633]